MLLVMMKIMILDAEDGHDQADADAQYPSLRLNMMTGSSSRLGFGDIHVGHGVPVLGLAAKSCKGARPVSWTQWLGVLAQR